MLIKPITSMSLTKLLVMNRNELRIVQKFTKDLLCLIKKQLISKRMQGRESCDC
jgi:hypothetical protein